MKITRLSWRLAAGTGHQCTRTCFFFSLPLLLLGNVSSGALQFGDGGRSDFIHGCQFFIRTRARNLAARSSNSNTGPRLRWAFFPWQPVTRLGTVMECFYIEPIERLIVISTYLTGFCSVLESSPVRPWLTLIISILKPKIFLQTFFCFMYS